MGEPLQKELPFKLFYKIGEVSRIVGVNPHVIRFWENEFPHLKPRKTRGGQRLYTKREIDTLLLIKRLLYEEKYTLEGVRRKLNRIYQDSQTHRGSRSEVIEKVKIKLKEILEILS